VPLLEQAGVGSEAMSQMLEANPRAFFARA
jgi:predicted metal-dependent phosphotriesterase family hydrolase